MKDIFCNKLGHDNYPLYSYEKDGKIYVDLNSCINCNKEKKDLKLKDNIYFQNKLRGISNFLDGIEHETNRLKNKVHELIGEFEIEKDV